jgi:hypothetical protein
LVVWLWAGALAAEPLPVPSGPVLLTLSGAITETNAPGEARFDRAMLEALGVERIRTKTAWTDGVKTFEGASLAAVLQRVGAAGTHLQATALNAYTVRLNPTVLRYNPILAMRVDDTVLTVRNRGPLWIVFPRDQYPELDNEASDDMWAWQLSRLHVE